MSIGIVFLCPGERVLSWRRNKNLFEDSKHMRQQNRGSLRSKKNWSRKEIDSKDAGNRC